MNSLIIASFQAFSPTQKKAHAREFIETWAEISSGRFDPLPERQSQMEAFNLSLVVDRDLRYFTA